MPLAKITSVSGKGVFVPGNDIDTDRIIPARFMKCVTFDGLGQYLFRDVRFDPKTDAPLGHPLDAPKHKGASVLLSGRNFGCGSSREHAPQALQKFGIRAVVAENFAEIFFGNCTTLGIPCLQATAEDIAKVAAIIAAAPETAVTVDLTSNTITAGSFSAPVQIKDGARQSLMKGEWDALGQLIDGRQQVAELAGKLEYFNA